MTTGKGQCLDIALLDSAVSVLGLPVGIVAATGQSPGRLGNAHPSLAPYEPYLAADGYVVVAVANPRLWSRFCAAIGAEALEHDPRFASNTDRLANRAALNARIRQVCSRTRPSTRCWSGWRGRRAVRPGADHRPGACAIRSSPPARCSIDIPTGAGAVKMPGNPIKLSAVPVLADAPPPALGQHTEDVRTVDARTTQGAPLTR